MCLIDPQAHTYVVQWYWLDRKKLNISGLRSEPQSSERLYWDGGPLAVTKFMDHHLQHCDENTVCKSLGLRTLEVEDDSSDDGKSPVKRSSKRPPHIDLTKSRTSSTVRQSKMGPLRIGKVNFYIK